MSRKNQVYTNELKLAVVQAYLRGEGSYQSVTDTYGIKNSSQVKDWVKKFNKVGSIEAFRRLPSQGSGAKGVSNPLKGKRIHFNSVEEERDYYKAQVEYLKKQFPNL